MTEPGTEPAATPAKPAKDAGAILKQARLRHGQSLEVVFQHTRIPKKLLEALENNRFDDFPAEVYLRGFLKSYCEHLDIEFEPLWSQIRPPQSPAEAAKKPEAAPSAPEPARPKEPSAPSQPAAPATPYSYASFAAITAAGVLAVIAFVWGFQSRGHKAPPPPPLSQRPPQAIPLAVRPPEKMTLKMVFLNETWVSLRCDDRLRFEGRGPAGLTQTWSAKKEFRLRTSTPGDVALEIDGKAYPLRYASRSGSGEYIIRRP